MQLCVCVANLSVRTTRQLPAKKKNAVHAHQTAQWAEKRRMFLLRWDRGCLILHDFGNSSHTDLSLRVPKRELMKAQTHFWTGRAANLQSFNTTTQHLMLCINCRRYIYSPSQLYCTMKPPLAPAT